MRRVQIQATLRQLSFPLSVFLSTVVFVPLKAFLYFYGNYTRQQERMTPNFQRFYALVKEKYGDNIPQELRNEFRAASKPLMKYTNILTFNTRAIALYISLLIGEPWLYFVFEIIVMTSLFVYMRHCHEAVCEQLYYKYAAK